MLVLRECLLTFVVMEGWVICKAGQQAVMLKEVTEAVRGETALHFSTAELGSVHVKITVKTPKASKLLLDFLNSFWQKQTRAWEDTREMLIRKQFECYMMLDSTQIKQLIGKDGVNIRRLRKTLKCKVFIVPLLFRHTNNTDIYFDIWIKRI